MEDWTDMEAWVLVWVQLEHTMMELEGRLMPPRAFQEFLETQELQPALTGARFLEEAQVGLTPCPRKSSPPTPRFR